MYYQFLLKRKKVSDSITTEQELYSQVSDELAAKEQEAQDLLEKTPEESEEDAKVKEISELSKRGYQLLKENEVNEAKEMFSKILDIEENNNYALVGLGDAERKQNNFNIFSKSNSLIN